MKIINVKNYDMKKESLHLVYWDINNLYGWATSQKLNDFKWVEERSQLMNISIYIYIYVYSGINESKQRELELIVLCLHNHSANL